MMDYPTDTPTQNAIVAVSQRAGVDPARINASIPHVKGMVNLCYQLSAKSGWWHDPQTGEPLQRNKGEMIALMHSELSEALEGVRKNKPDDHLPDLSSEAVEMADTIIRIFDYCGGHDIDVVTALVRKLGYNCRRADHKPENRAKEGGKAF